MRVICFGIPGPLAAHALAALLESGAEVVAVAVPAPPGAPAVSALPAPRPPRPSAVVPLTLFPPGPRPAAPGPQPPTPLVQAAERGIPALALRQLAAPEVRAAIAAAAPDLAVVACWPWRIPPALLALPRLGFLNLHPSPLPALRGPEPLFWALREGRERTAVTLHWMDEGLDTGDIAAAAPLELPMGAALAELEGLAAELAGQLLVALLPRLQAGERPGVPQGPGGSYRPAPRNEDFRIDPRWPARRAFSFMHGAAAWGVPFGLEAGGLSLRLGAALGYAPAGELGAPVVVAGGVARVQMAPGVLEATLAHG